MPVRIDPVMVKYLRPNESQVESSFMAVKDAHPKIQIFLVVLDRGQSHIYGKNT